MLETTALACERGGRRLFSDLGFALGAGELLRVRGPNGAGKTSLLRILAGLTRPDDGRVTWRGRERDWDFGREMLFLGHAPALKDELTVYENFAFSCQLSFLEEERTALEKVGVAKLADLPARFLSQGQRKRVALARLAVASAMPLWLLDEPFAALDEEAIGAVRGLIEDHLRAGGLVVLTSHQEFPLAARAERAVALG
jgi:heme exporter protein A